MKHMVTVRLSDPLGRLMLPLDGTRYHSHKSRPWRIEETEEGFLLTPVQHCCALCGREGEFSHHGRFAICPDCLRELGLEEKE